MRVDSYPHPKVETYTVDWFIPPPLDILIVSHFCVFVKGFFAFFFEPAQDGSLTPLAPISHEGRTQRLKVCTPLPLTPIVYHTCPQIAIGKIHKIGIFISSNFVQLFA